MKTIYLALSAVIISGCASNSGVVPVGPDTYLISRQAASGFSGMGALKAKALKQASEYCTSQKKFMTLVSTNDAQPPYILGNFPRTEIQFMCLDKDDPEFARPKLQKVPDTVIEVR